MANYEINVEGLEAFRKALQRNPEKIKREVKNLIQRAIAKYNAGIIRNPWKVGMSGGGSPVATIASAGYKGGTLRDTHLKNIGNWEAKIYPNADYAKYVHAKRPWLDHVFADKQPEIRQLEEQFLNETVKDLAR